MCNKVVKVVVAAVAIAAIAALSVALVSSRKELSAAKAKMAAEPSVFDAIATRTSIRMFDKTRPVGEELIEKMLRAAMAAPTAVNKQPWEFVVVTDKATLNALSKVHPHARIENGARPPCHRGLRFSGQRARWSRQGILGAGLLCRHGGSSSCGAWPRAWRCLVRRLSDGRAYRPDKRDSFVAAGLHAAQPCDHRLPSPTPRAKGQMEA